MTSTSTAFTASATSTPAAPTAALAGHEALARKIGEPLGSAGAAAAWLAEHPDAVVVPVAEAFEVARVVVDEYTA